MRTFVRVATGMSFVALLLSGQACEVEKSSNPLSPTVAGPLPGVNISAPKPLQPPNGASVPNAQQPLQLLIENASSNSPRPFWQVVEVATDAGFNSIAYKADKLEPGPEGRTAHRLPGALAAGRTYFWRIHAEDGANVGPYSSTFNFVVRPTTVIEPPTPQKPVGGVTTATDAPEFTVVNGAVSNPEGDVVYRFELSLNEAFTQLAALVTVARSSGQTTTMNTTNLGGERTVYWRVYGTDHKTTSAKSAVAWFKTPKVFASPGPSPVGPAPPSGGYRTPDPPPGQQLPLPNMAFVVQDVANQYPQALQNSCQPNGGSWEFMDRVVDRLRQYDTRWGYNWKRGNVGDPSLDVVDYHWGPGPDEGSPDVYAIDIVIGHCGPTPGAAWINITDPNGAGAKWTGRGRF